MNEEKDVHIKKYLDTCEQGISYSRNPNILQNQEPMMGSWQNTKIPFGLVVVGFLEPVKSCINYSGTSPQWPPLGQKKLAVMGRKGCTLTNVFRGSKTCLLCQVHVFHNGYPNIKMINRAKIHTKNLDYN